MMTSPLRSLLRFWLVLVMAALGGVVSFYNQQQVVVSFPYFGMYETPLGFALIASFILGVSLVVFYFFIEYAKKVMKIRSLTKELERLRSPSSHD